MRVISELVDFGTIYTVTSKLSEAGSSYFVYPDVIDFLPGGISMTYGTAAPRWELLIPVTPIQEISKTVGYIKQIGI